MKNLFQENSKPFFLLLILLSVLLFTVYLLFYRPLKEELVVAEQEETSLTEQVALLEVRLETLSEEQEQVNNEELLKKLPLTPDVDKLLVTLDEMEGSSDSLIKVLHFGYDGEMPDRSMLEATETTDGEEETTDTDEEAVEEAVAEEAYIATEELPPGLKPIVVTMDVTSSDYNDFQKLLKAIEGQERTMFISAIDFNTPFDRSSLEDEPNHEMIRMTIDLTTFYFDQGSPPPQ